MAVDAQGEWAADLAKQLIRTGNPPPTDLDDAQRLALAWALKECAIAAWSSAPNEVVVAAEVLSALQVAITADIAPPADAEIQAIAAWAMGIADLTRGKMADAIARLDSASTRFRALGQLGHAAHSQVPKIMALSMLGRQDEATASGVETLRVLEEIGDFHPAGKVSLNLGNLYCHREEYVESIPHFKHAQLLFSRVGDPQWSVMSEIGIANAYASIGQFRLALEVYATAEVRATKHSIPVLEAMVKEHLALVNLARGHFRESLAGLESSRRCYEQLAMPQHQAIVEKQLADAYLELRLLPEALELFSSAVSRFEFLEMQVERAWALTQRGRTLVALARPSKEIDEDLDRAWSLFKAQNATAGQAAVLLVRATLAMSQNDPEAALVLAGDAADAFTASALPLGHAQAIVVRANALLQCAQVDAASSLFAVTLAKAQELQLLSIGVRCQIGLGLVANARNQSTAAEAAFESAIAASEEQRGALPGDDIRGAFLMDQLRPYEELLRIALDRFDAVPSGDAASQVLVQLERFRARALGDRLGEPKTPIAATLIDNPDADRRAHLSWLYRRRQKLIDEGDDPHALTEETRRVEHELLELARRRRFTVNINPLSTEVRAFDPARLQAALGDGEAVVEYGVMDDELFACVVTGDQIALRRRLARWSDVLEAIHAARFQIDALRHGAGAVDRHLEQLTRRSMVAMRRLHDLAWAPLTSLLTGCRRVLVVPHDQLGSLQFAALRDGDKYLAQTLEIAMAPSASIALYGIARKPVTAGRALVLGESSRLVHAADEANFVAGLFDESEVLIGAAADAASLRAACAEADVLHLACHAEFRSDNPMFSALQLADGPFTVQDAETLRLRQGVVVLSACETGVAACSRGDEMIGLVRAFLVAGASRVVASLWPVDDAVTMQFMAAFYRSLRAGNSPAAALRVTQLDVMQAHPHPFHWAAFTLYGGW